MAVDLGNLAQHDPLALEIKQRVLSHVPGSSAERAFGRMWGTIVIVRRSLGPSVRSSLRELTLRFDYGRLVVHDGRVGRPDISLWGTDGQVLALGDAVSGRTLPTRAWSVARTISGVSGSGSGGDQLQVFGGLAHPRLLYRLSLVLSDVSRLHEDPRRTSG
jgi:hypothetical protein